MSVTNPDQVSCAMSSNQAICEYTVNHIRPTQKALSPCIHLIPHQIFKITRYMQSLCLQIHPFTYHQFPSPHHVHVVFEPSKKKDLILPQSICPHKKGLNLFLQIHPIPYHQSPLTMLLREALSVERRRQTKVTLLDN